MRGWKRQESHGWGCQPKIVIREKRRAGGRGRVRLQGGERAGETSRLVPVSGSQPPARALCPTALRLTASAPHLPPRSWFQGTAGLESLPPSSPSGQGFAAVVQPLLSLGGFLTQKVCNFTEARGLEASTVFYTNDCVENQSRIDPESLSSGLVA